MVGQGMGDLLRRGRGDHAELASPLEQLGQVVLQVVHIGAEEVVAVEADDGVEELLRIRQRPRVGMDREDAVLEAGLTDALRVVGRVDPEIGRPHLEAELLGEEDRAHRPSAAQVHHPHPRLQLHHLAEGLRKPQHVRPHLVGDHPLRIVLRREREALVMKQLAEVEFLLGHHSSPEDAGPGQRPPVTCGWQTDG